MCKTEITERERSRFNLIISNIVKVVDVSIILTITQVDIMFNTEIVTKLIVQFLVT